MSFNRFCFEQREMISYLLPHSVLNGYTHYFTPTVTSKILQ